MRDYTNLKEKIKLFNNYGISQTKIAQMANIDRSVITKWLNGNRQNISEESKNAIYLTLKIIAENLYKNI